LDPVQFMVIGQKDRSKDFFYWDTYVSSIFREMDRFRNLVKNRVHISDSISEIRKDLLKLVNEVPQFMGLTVSFNDLYDKILASKNSFRNHPMQQYLKELFISLDRAYYRGKDLMQIIDNFLDTQLRPHVLK
jgi:hypothetical protein